MAQIGGIHPDNLVPYWHAARQLTPSEGEIVGRIVHQYAPAVIEERKQMIQEWLELLPPIPPRRSDRLKWALELENGHRYDNAEAERRFVSRLDKALRGHDLVTALALLTDERPYVPNPRVGDLRPEWRRTLQGIRDALETRIDDALERAVATKAAEAE